MNAFDALRQLNDDAFLRYLHEEIQIKGRHMELMERDTTLHRESPTILHNALEENKSTEYIQY